MLLDEIKGVFKKCPDFRPFLIQNFINNRKREQREADKDKRDLEYHEARMKEYRK